jgi:predicted DNA-binding WGR domain protein
MVAITLARADSAKNMCRFYRLDVQPDLFGAWCCIREWGRIGSAGRVRAAPFATAAEAQRAFEDLRQAKERRGYSANRQR